MPKFEYVVSDSSGRKKEGTVRASSKVAATDKLREKNDIIISVTEREGIDFLSFLKPSMSLEDRITFTKSLATMIKVGITVTEGFEIILDQTKPRDQRRMFENILDRIRTGQSLASSLRKYDSVFSNLYVNMVQTGEESGNLEKVLQRLTIQLEKEYEVRRRVVSALIYPSVIVSITVLMAVGIVLFIMPKITKIFERFDFPLPLPTRMLIGFSRFVTDHTLLALFGTVAIVVGLVVIFKVKFLKPFWHTVFLKLPVFGNILVFANVARLARTMNSLLQAGVPVAEGLKMTGDMLDNVLYKTVLEEVSEKVEKGGGIGENLEKHEKLFPQLATKMIYIGEKTGSLEVTTKHIAQLYERDVENKTKNLSVLLEPFLLVFMAVMVGGIALSIILPIYQLPNLLNK
jgi:type IV pilus assembly protein PilC